MANVERYAAKGVFDPAAYSQAVKVSGAQTTLYLAGQVAYDDKGGPAHRGDFTAQARAVFQAVKAQVEAGGGTMQNRQGQYLPHRHPPPRRPRAHSGGVLRQEGPRLHAGRPSPRSRIPTGSSRSKRSRWSEEAA